MKIFRQTLFFILRFSGLPFLLRHFIQGQRMTILCYHDPAPEVFARHLTALKKNYNIIGLKDFLQARENNPQAIPARALIITLDDGYAGNRFLLELVRAMNVPVTIFVCSAVTENLKTQLTHEQIRQLAPFVDFQSHARSHLPLPSLEDARAQAE